MAANARSNANSGNVPQFSEDMLKAADQGAGDNVLLALDADFDITTDAGRKKTMNFLTGSSDYDSEHSKYDGSGVGMTEQEALDLLSRMQGRNWADKKAVQTGAVTMGKSGQLRLAKSHERDAVVRKNIENNVLSVLTKGGKDGIGKKQSDGGYQLDPAALEAFKKEVGRVKDAIKKVGDSANNLEMDRATIKMLIDNAPKIGLGTDSTDILQRLQPN